MAKGPSVIPGLFYDDPNAALDWLAKAFGFELRLSFTDDAGRIAYAEVELGDGVVAVRQARGHSPHDRSPRDAGGVNTAHVAVAVPDVDAHCARGRSGGCARARAARGQVLRAPHLHGRGLRGASLDLRVAARRARAGGDALEAQREASVSQRVTVSTRVAARAGRGLRALHGRDRRVVGSGRGERRALERRAPLRAGRRGAPAEVGRRPGLRDRPRPASGSRRRASCSSAASRATPRAPAPRSRSASRAAQGGTRVTLEHRGFETLPEDHPARGGLAREALLRLWGRCWTERLEQAKACAEHGRRGDERVRHAADVPLPARAGGAQRARLVRGEQAALPGRGARSAAALRRGRRAEAREAEPLRSWPTRGRWAARCSASTATCASRRTRARTRRTRR